MRDYECPLCGEWNQVDAENGDDDVTCAGCKAPLRFVADADFDGGWHDKSGLFTKEFK